jgi:hypothetical protein
MWKSELPGQPSRRTTKRVPRPSAGGPNQSSAPSNRNDKGARPPHRGTTSSSKAEPTEKEIKTNQSYFSQIKGAGKSGKLPKI